MMRIEFLSSKPDRAGRFSVKFDDGTVLRLYRQTVEDFGLYSGFEMDEAGFHNLKESAGQTSAKMRAVRIVSAANVSRKDLEERLVRKGEDPEQARTAVEWMESLHLLDDRNTAEQVVHSCISKGYGIARAKQALYEKKIPKEYWDDVLTDYPDQMEKMISFLRSRLDEDSDDRDIRRAVDSLLRRGHSYGKIKEALRFISLDFDETLED